jgi:serine/threonine-protein kinase HipA
VERFEGIAFNEALCMKLAAKARLLTASVDTFRVNDVDCLTVERYDRINRPVPSGEPLLERIHQEDFCQALGMVPEHKYQ